MTLTPFANEPLTNFADSANQVAFGAAIDRVEAELGRDWPLVINGEPVTTGQWLVSINPSQKDQVIGRVARAGRAEADREAAIIRALREDGR